MQRSDILYVLYILDIYDFAYFLLTRLTCHLSTPMDLDPLKS